MISGFVIPYSLWNTAYSPRHFINYFIKRIARICPPAYINIALILLQWFIIDYILHHNTDRITSLSFETIIRNILFLYKPADAGWVNGVFWTLSIEFQFYIIIGLLFNIIFRTNSFILTTSLFILFYLIGLIPILHDHSYFYYNSLFAMGAVTLVYHKKRTSVSLYLLSLAIFSILCYFTNGLLPAIFGLSTALTIAFVRMKNVVFSFLGKISFSLYLIHGLVGSTAEFVLNKIFHPSTERNHIIGIVIIIIISCISAYLYYLLIEKPVLNLTKRIRTSY